MGSFLDMNLKDLIDEEKIRIVDRITPTIESYAQNPELLNICGSMRRTSETLKRALSREIASDITELIHERDDIRDNSIELIDDAINYFSKKKQPHLQDAAQVLRKKYDDAFDGISLRNNTLESVRINMFLESMAEPEAQNAVHILELQSEMADLSTSHPEYLALEKQRAEFKESDDTPLLKPSRRNLNKKLSYLENHLEYHHDEGDTLYREIFDKIRPHISDVMTIARARKTRKENTASNENSDL